MKLAKQKRFFLSFNMAFFLVACGGGSGVGPGEVNKRQDELKEKIKVDWETYESGDLQSALGAFQQTLLTASTKSGTESIRNQVMSEAQNGIGWIYFKTQSLDSASVAFNEATKLNRRNEDAWAGWAGVALANKRYSDAARYADQALSIEPDYNSATRNLDQDKNSPRVGHDNFDERHLRLVLAEAYFHMGRYSAAERSDPKNAAAQVRLLQNNQFVYIDPGKLLEAISIEAQKLQDTF